MVQGGRKAQNSWLVKEKRGWKKLFHRGKERRRGWFIEGRREGKCGSWREGGKERAVHGRKGEVLVCGGKKGWGEGARRKEENKPLVHVWKRK